MTSSNSNVNCCVYGCASVRKRNPELSYHSFPNEKQQVTIVNDFGETEIINRRQLWEAKLRMGKKVSRWMKVCSLHFKAEDFIHSGGGLWTGKKDLLSTAIPSVSLPQLTIPLVDEDKKREIKNARTKRLKGRQLQQQQIQHQSEEISVDNKNLSGLESTSFEAAESLMLLSVVQITRMKTVNSVEHKIEKMKEEINEQNAPAVTTIDCTHEIEEYQCPRCKFKTKFLAYILQHLEDGCQLETFDEVVYKCLKCYFQTYSKYLIVRHGFVCKSPTTDDETKNSHLSCKVHKQENTFRAQEEDASLRNTKQAPNRHFEAKSTCNLKTQKRTEFKSTTNQSNEFQDTLFKHEDCPASLKLKQCLKQHIESLNSKSENIEWFKCEMCSSKFKKEAYLTGHIKLTHVGDENIHWFKCEQCPRKFKQRAYWRSHIKYQHPDPKDWFACEECSSRFEQKHALKKHIRSCHSDPKDIQCFKCEHCTREFKHKEGLMYHVKYIHADSKVVHWFKCEHCPRRFTRKGSLMTHVACRHTEPKDVVWFTCALCSYKCKSKYNLKRHGEVHSKPKKRFECALCSSRFELREGLKTHIQNLHF